MICSQLNLTWADPHAGKQYCAADLSPEDALRARHKRGPKAQSDWQVSRALLHACRGPATAGGAQSLSHSNSHALLAQGPSGWLLGVDMEKVRPRRVLDLAQWACSPGEIEWLRGQPDEHARLQRFYMLWTLKEAFIKACSLSFPAALRRFGLDAGLGKHPVLRAPAGAWRARSYRLEPDWVVSAVWLPAGDDLSATEPQWNAGPASVLPSMAALGSWSQGHTPTTQLRRSFLA